MKLHLLQACIVTFCCIPQTLSKEQKRQQKSTNDVEKIIDKLIVSQRFNDIVDKIVERAFYKVTTKNGTNGKSEEQSLDLDKFYDKSRKTINNNVILETPIKIDIIPYLKKNSLLPFKDISLHIKRFTKNFTSSDISDGYKKEISNKKNHFLKRYKSQDNATLARAQTEKDIKRLNESKTTIEQRKNMEISNENDNFQLTELDNKSHELNNSGYNHKHKIKKMRADSRENSEGIKHVTASNFYDKQNDKVGFTNYNHSGENSQGTDMQYKSSSKENKKDALDKIPIVSHEESDENISQENLTTKKTTTVNIETNSPERSEIKGYLKKFEDINFDTNFNVPDIPSMNFDRVSLNSRFDMLPNNILINKEKGLENKNYIRREGDKMYKYENSPDYKELLEKLSNRDYEVIGI